MSALEMSALGVAVQARAGTARLQAQRPRIRIASPQGFIAGLGVPLSNGSATGGTDRLGFVVNTTVRGLRFVFLNGTYTSSGPITGAGAGGAPGNAIRISAVLDQAPIVVPISLPNPTGAAISIGGRSAHAVGDMQFVQSQPLNSGTWSPATTYFYRTHKSVGPGEKWPFTHGSGTYTWLGGTTSDTVYGGSVKDGSDLTIGYAGAGSGFTSPAYAFGAAAILGEQIAPLPVILITGDSISAGNGETLMRGYLVRAAESAGIGWFNAGVGGVTLNSLASYGQFPQWLAQFADHVVIHALTNDLTGNTLTLAAARTRVLAAARAFAAPENKVWFCTILPRTMSSDGWVTIAGQTLNAFEPVRVAINNWMRDRTGTGMTAYLVANGIDAGRIGGCVDACPAVERNASGTALALDASGQQAAGSGGYWIVTGAAGYATTDGTHPTAAAAALLAPLVPTAAMTIG